MKVILLNDELQAGGAEKVLVNMANLLHAKGLEVSVVLLLRPAAIDSLIHTSIPVYYLKRAGRLDYRAMRMLKELVQHAGIVHVHSRHNLRYFMVARFLTGISGPKVIFHEHIPILSVNFFTRYCFRKANAYVAVVQSMCRWATDSLHIAPSRVFYLPNTINAPSGNITQQQAGYRIIMVGNFWHFKNQLFAVDLINALPENYTLDMYGTVNDLVYHKDIIDKIAKHNLKHRIRLIEGISNIYSIVGNYNFAIHTSPHETGPLVLLEYMYAGLPFLTYKTGDVVSNIEDELPELVMDSFDIDTWKNAIASVMSNNNTRQHLRVKMRSLIRRNYSEEKYWEMLKGIYDVVLLGK